MGDTSNMLHKTATVLLVSEELSQFNDSNLKYVTEQLQALNYSVEKTAIILYKEAALAAEIHATVKQSDVVILIGGILSRHSNQVARVVSKIFHQKLVFNEKLSTESKEPNVPMHAKILDYSSNVPTYPVVYIQGLLLVTDELEPLKQSLTNIVAPFLKNFNRKPRLKRTLIVGTAENMNLMQKIPRKDSVEVSCEMAENDVRVTLTSTNVTSLYNYEESFKASYGEHLIRCREGSDIPRLVYKQTNYAHIRSSVEHIEKCFAKYGPENVFISFNGGKDCTVLLHLTLGVLRKLYPNHTDKTFCVYIENANSFPELNNFIGQCKWYYDLDVLKLSEGIKESLAFVLQNKPHMKACLMGTRRTDPFSENLEPFQMTDPDWPQLMRVSPLLDWHYSEIWDYLLNLKVPYCSLYDVGYTSLGSRTNTIRNPSLAMYDVLKDATFYLPGYKLLNSACERSGRKKT